ncbi:hypothetical protein TNCV_3385741 [Trichonephila clavipes]|uniref:Uncharacterized protein n=1 Tax=Trichonephila clavipes TaxID=2585209 RepID=A0A8X6VQN6_TRICX|nr:hypothetical protein TNCV_3385741 [Trichonephila clavipes]
MLWLGKTRPLLGRSSIGSIRTRAELRSGVPPPTTESNERGSVLVIWQKTRHGTYLDYTQNISLQHQGEDQTGKRAPPLSAALILQQCFFGDTEERYHQPIDRSGLSPTTRLQ